MVETIEDRVAAGTDGNGGASGRDPRPGSTRPAAGQFDFGDGAVTAARHPNPDGTPGGWVAFTAHVESSATVEPGAVVYGNARVFDHAQVLDQAIVCDTARLHGTARVAERAIVRGDATIENAEITEDAVVEGQARVSHGARVTGRARVRGKARVMGLAVIQDDALVEGPAWITSGDIGGRSVIAGTIQPAPPPRASTAAALSGPIPETDDYIDLDDLLDFT